MYKITSAVALTLFLSGCALPVPIKVAGWAIDGILYLTTQKSLTDHGISQVAGEDCALFRVALGEEVCVPLKEETEAIASLESFPGIGGLELADIPTEFDAGELAQFETAAGPAEIASLPIEQWDAEFAKTLEFSYVAPKTEGPVINAGLDDIPEIREVVEIPGFDDPMEVTEVAPKSDSQIKFTWDLVDATTGVTYQ